MKKENIVLITCEASLDPEVSLELGRDWGITKYEIRQCFSPDTRVPFFNTAEEEYLKTNLSRYGGQIVCISPGLFIGCDATEDAARREFNDKLPRCLRFCEKFGVTDMIVFAFKKSANLDWVLNKVGKAVEIAAREGIRMHLEPLVGHNGDSGDTLAAIVNGVNHKNFDVNWDPGNIYFAGTVPDRAQFDAVKKRIGYVHFKDCVRMTSEPGDGSQWAVLGKGKVDWPAQMKALKEARYDGYLSIESHTFYNKVKTTHENFDAICRWVG